MGRAPTSIVGYESPSEREDGPDMNPYAIVGSSAETADAASLRERLIAWHDAMVAHERRLRVATTDDRCHDECPHADARTLWAEVCAALGPRASELAFLRSRALDAAASSDPFVGSTESVSEEVETARRSRPMRPASARERSTSSVNSSDPSQMAAAEA
jgi:hypothetical protein